MVLFGLATGPLRLFNANGRSMFRYELSDQSRDPAQSHVQGLGDCLQFLQFIFLTSCITLPYPGFFRAIIGQLAWSSLIFRNWPVTHGFAYPGVENGLYATNTTWGLEEMTQLLGGTTISDLWVNAIVNLLFLIVGIVVLVQFPFGFQWAPRIFRRRQAVELSDLQEESLTQFQRTGWSFLRAVLDHFLLPLVTFSTSQSILASWLPAYRTFLAVATVGLISMCLGATVRPKRASAGVLAYSILSLYAAMLVFGFLVPCLISIVLFVLRKMGIAHFDGGNLARTHQAPVVSKGFRNRSTFAAVNKEDFIHGASRASSRSTIDFRAPRPVTPRSSMSHRFSTIQTQSHSEDESVDSSMNSVDLSVLDEDTTTISGDGDYSKREADQYYGRQMVLQAHAGVERTEAVRFTEPDRPLRWPWKAKKKTKGFEVVRPGRPGL
ncbi:uncharacterized protein BP01DRAFT_420920 [Aspergillus saccharolyticus JOP 1030-1]|uniref:TRP C-terminal domain-containing protein n=1 Tax=Aspergillus saccharolyticus JOP 1030-1 TaxID=1450539 RepID=A0A318ZVQ1_9EURO|nr:hypothetical protein BP01DRAFT_420920 [Aspergillus saccharolyticus JOP 1030-1]PYH48433.1 hypothetical protein BP01DRAFT_420920 [Aspergillus saccharolyticus JOP 1030-1]